MKDKQRVVSLPRWLVLRHSEVQGDVSNPILQADVHLLSYPLPPGQELRWAGRGLGVPQGW